MHDPKFEKEVQQKLEELSFSPSEAVWTKVERAVNGKKRRRIPLFWLFFLPGLMLVGAGMIYFSGARTTRAVRPTAAVVKGSSTSASTGVQTATGITAQPATGTAIQSATGIATQSATGIAAQTRTVPAFIAGPIDPVAVSDRKDGTEKAGAAYNEKAGGTDDVAAGIGGLKTGGDQKTDVAETKAPRAILPGLKSFDHHFSAVAASRLPSRNLTAAATKATIHLQPKYTWETGFAGGVGVSSLNKTLFQQPVVMSDLSANATPLYGRPKTYTSQIKPDLSYWAGIVAQRPLARSITLSVGLNLHYYSTRVQIGEKVDDPSGGAYSSPSGPNNNPSLPTNNTFQFLNGRQTVTAAVYPYYSVGDKDVFVNRYYFLELPGSILWQVNHSRNLPLFWETGVSLSYLVGSSAISYNAKSGVFYKDNGVTNRAQFNVATAFLVGLPIRGVRLQAGPQIQYGVTSLQTLGSSGQHLFYGGIRLLLLPGKTKK